MSHANGPRTGRPPTRAPLGMVSSSHYLATASGLRMLQNGGSAVDAIIATNAVLCIAYPHMAGLGGDGFWLIHDPRDKKVRALDASGPAGARATRNWYSERVDDDEIPARGGLAALTVPGAVDGWREAHEAYGKLSWRELFDDAIRYAAQGVPVSRSLADWLAQDVPVLSDDEDAAAVLLDDGRAMRDGERLVQADLARSIETVARDGARGGFYEGELAERFCAALARKGSPLEAQDLAEYRAEWVEPIETTYRDHRVLEFPPATQGFAALQVLNLIEDYDIVGWGDNTADYYHHLAEAVKVAFADRDAWLTDPRFVDIPLDKLISKDYAKERRELIDPEKALDMEDVEPGVEWDADRRREEVGAGAGRGARRRSPEGDTVYFCAVDADGLVVSAIQSVYHDFGAGVIAGDTGIIPQNRGSFFSLDADHPNRLEPGKRTFHTIIPAMLLDGDEPAMAFGSMGGEGQPQTHAALLTRVLDFGYDVQQAIEAPRWLMGRTWGVESRDLSLEGRVPDQVLRELELRGQPVKVLADWNDNMGHAAAIRIDRRSGFLEGGADPRGDGAAAGY
jgi:oxamate amidohydrolase